MEYIKRILVGLIPTVVLFALASALLLGVIWAATSISATSLYVSVLTVVTMGVAYFLGDRIIEAYNDIPKRHK